MVEEGVSLNVRGYERARSQSPYFVAGVAMLTLCATGVFGYFFSKGRQAQNLQDISARTAGIVQEQNIEKTLEERAVEPLKTNLTADKDPLIISVYGAIAGKDRILDPEDFRDFLKEISFLKEIKIDTPLTRYEGINFVLSDAKNEKDAYDVFIDRSGLYSRNTGSGTGNLLGKVKAVELSKFADKHKPK